MSKGFDILVGDLYVRKPRVLPSELFQRLLAAVNLRLPILLRFQQFAERLFKHFFTDFRAFDDNRNGFAGHFFLHLTTPFSAAVQVMLYERGVIAVDRGRCVVKCRQ